MEKTIQKFVYVNGNDLESVNNELASGWIVKSVTAIRPTPDNNVFGESKDSVKFLVLLQK